MESPELAAKVLIVGLLWLLLASPLLVGAIFVARLMRRRRVNSRLAILAFAFSCGFLLAPVPAAIITVFVPNALALIDGSYYGRLFGANTFFHQLWWWIIPSLVITAFISCVAASRYFHRSAYPGLRDAQL